MELVILPSLFHGLYGSSISTVVYVGNMIWGNIILICSNKSVSDGIKIALVYAIFVFIAIMVNHHLMGVVMKDLVQDVSMWSVQLIGMIPNKVNVVQCLFYYHIHQWFINLYRNLDW